MVYRLEKNYMEVRNFKNHENQINDDVKHFVLIPVPDPQIHIILYCGFYPLRQIFQIPISQDQEIMKEC